MPRTLRKLAFGLGTAPDYHYDNQANAKNVFHLEKNKNQFLYQSYDINRLMSNLFVADNCFSKYVILLLIQPARPAFHLKFRTRMLIRYCNKLIFT